MPQLLDPTLEEMMILCVEREVRLRKQVYPRWVAAGKIKLDRAEREIEVMEAVAQVLRDEKVAQELEAKIVEERA